jgi:uncharacterized phage-like protein YoqJ
MNSEHVIGVTGHRPSLLGGYRPEAFARLTSFARHVLQREKPDAVISGMALGWDQAVATAAIELGIKLVAAVPFAGQEKKWPPDAQAAYRRLLSGASLVEVVSPGGYSARKMHGRNEWIVDRCTRLIALWSGAPGGTAACVKYAEGKGRGVANFWSEWLEWRL